MKKTSKLVIPIKCEDCAFLRTPCPAIGKKSCTKLGAKPTDSACQEFVADMSLLCDGDTATMIGGLGQMVKGLDPQNLRILSWTFRNMVQLVKTRFTFGQKVWFNLSAPREDYLDCWFTGHVLGVHHDQNSIIIVGTDDKMFLGRTVKGMSVTMDPTSVMGLREWKVHKARLKEMGKVSLPEDRKHRLPIIGSPMPAVKAGRRFKPVEPDEVPTIDKPVEAPAPKTKKSVTGMYVIS